VRVLFAKVFGLGNAVLSVPAVKMLLRAGANVTVVVGDTPDDAGAREVFVHLAHALDVRARLRVVSLPVVGHAGHFDVAILSMPYDGRWRQNVNFTADVVLDGRPRPDPTAPLGLECWKKHEVDYQIDVVRKLFPNQEYHQVPSTSFLQTGPFLHLLPKFTYLGVGYKRDSARYWTRKHWGTERYAELVCRILASDPDVIVLSSGSPVDVQQTLAPIARRVASEFADPSRFYFKMCDMEDMFKMVSLCSTYVGNDTGTMHVAASIGARVLGLFFMPGAEVKNSPYCSHRRVITTPSPELLSVDKVFEEWTSICPMP